MTRSPRHPGSGGALQGRPASDREASRRDREPWLHGCAVQRPDGHPRESAGEAHRRRSVEPRLDPAASLLDIVCVQRFMLAFGLVSPVFDYLNFAVLLGLLRCSALANRPIHGIGAVGIPPLPPSLLGLLTLILLP